MTTTHDLELQQQVLDELLRELRLEEERIRVVVRHGVVTLRGECDRLEDVLRAQRCVMRVRGARAVINELSVCSPALTEDADYA